MLVVLDLRRHNLNSNGQAAPCKSRTCGDSHVPSLHEDILPTLPTGPFTSETSYFAECCSSLGVLPFQAYVGVRVSSPSRRNYNRKAPFV